MMTDKDFFKNIRIYFLVFVVILIAGVAVVITAGLSGTRKVSKNDLSASAEIAAQERDEDNDLRLEDEASGNAYVRGEPGDDSPILTEEQRIVESFKTGKPHSRVTLTELALEYDGHIPYAVGGRSFEKGFHKYTSGIDNRGRPPELQTGLDSWGYIIWLYKNVFGTLNATWLAPERAIPSWEPVKKDELQVGDIGMMAPVGEKPNHYGVCIGFFDKQPVFSHCVNIPRRLYPLGCTCLSFLDTDSGYYIDGSGPVSFNQFCRPAVIWED